jgi:hypothetical protein
MTKARDIADNAGQGGGGGKNVIINGAMTIAKRGGSFASLTSGYAYTLDRFARYIHLAGTWTMSQSTDTPTGQGFANSLKVDCTTARTSLDAATELVVLQRIEGQNLQRLKKGTANAEKVTLSFWVKSAKTGTYIAELFDSNNSRHISKSYTISAANTWEKKELTFDGDTTGALANTNASAIQLNFWLSNGSNWQSGTLQTSWGANTQANRAVGQVNLADSTSNDWYLTGVMLEVGDKATDFEHRSFADELARCQRYYQQLDGNMFAYRYRASFIMNEIVLRTQMRAAPTFAFTGNGSATADWTAYNLTVDKVAAYVAIAASDDTNRYISALKISAEL